MPRVAMDFSKTVIYHFVCKDEMIKCSYVGSTTNFVKRKANHKSSCNVETKKDYHIKVYETIREHGGWNNWDMIPLEEFPCENKTQQAIREQYWIDQLKPEMNCFKAYISEEDKIEYQKAYNVLNSEVIAEKKKAYNILNAEVIAERKKAYNILNAEVITEYRKAYCEANSKVIAEKKKAWYEANRDRVNEKKKNQRQLKKQQETKQ